jgi:hypothetical protein
MRGAVGMQLREPARFGDYLAAMFKAMWVEARNMAEFTLRPQDGATQVTWAMHGPSPYIAKLMGIFFNMDQMIGKDFETGLANLKTASEK